MPAFASPMNSTIVRSMKMLSTRARLQVGAIVAPERAVSEAVRNSVIAPHIRRVVRAYPQLKLSEAIIGRIRQQLRERYDVELVVIYWSKDPTKFYPTTISWMIERTGAPMTYIPDLMPPLGLNLENALIPEDGHPNVRLNDAIASELMKRYMR